MLKIFIGYDPRQAISYNVLQQSIIARSTKPCSITPLIIEQLPLKRVGLTPFTYSRFLAPYLCDYKGWALFLDADILVLDDIAKLFELADDKYAVMVSKNIDVHDGLSMKFEWASVMLFNCEKCQMLTPEFIENTKRLHDISFVENDLIGDLPREWNLLVGYDKPRDDAKLLHYTQGIPIFPETIDSDYKKDWVDIHEYMNSSVPWVTLMGNSVHAKVVNNQIMPRYKKVIAQDQKIA